MNEIILYLDHDKSYLYAMQYSMRGKLMKGKRHMYRIYCMRCAKWHANGFDPCLCLPLWTCMDDFHVELCRQQQCIYCDGASEWRPRRYPRIFNIRPPKDLREDSVYSPRTQS